MDGWRPSSRRQSSKLSASLTSLTNKDPRLIRLAAVFFVAVLAVGPSGMALGQAPTKVTGAGFDSSPAALGTNGASSAQSPTKRQPLTFWQIIFSGGPLGIANMVVLIGLSIAALALALDDLRIVQKSRLVPD